MAVATAKDVANYLLRFSAKHGDYLTNLKLQKLLYYAQVWHLAFHEKPLFGDEIQAWIHGPVVCSVYSRFRDYKASPIPVEDLPMPKLPSQVKAHLNEIVRVFGGFSAYQLEKMTHSELPWQNAREGVSMDEPSQAVISCDDMKSFYQKLAKQK